MSDYDQKDLQDELQKMLDYFNGKTPAFGQVKKEPVNPNDYVRVCSKPYIAEDSDRWGIPTGLHYLSYIESGFVNKNLFEKLQKFIEFNKLDNAEALKDLFKETGFKSTVVEFNIMRTLDSDDYIRVAATLGSNSIRRYVKVRTWHLKLLIKLKNTYSRYFGENKKYRAFLKKKEG